MFSTKTKQIILNSLLIPILFSGCTHFATTSSNIENIEDKAYIGITETEFIEKIPTAKLVEKSQNQNIYLVTVGEPCLICGSGKAFLRSYEIYADQFTFEDSQLISYHRLINGK